MRCNRAIAKQRRIVGNHNNLCVWRGGVTLIEAILVILVLSGAAIASLFVLDADWVSNRTVKDLAIDVSQTLNAARNTAISNRCNVHVRRSRVNGSEQLEIVEEASMYRGEQRRTILLASGITLQARPSDIEFMPNGAARRDATWTMTQGRVSASIIVAPSTGRVTLQFPGD